MPYDQAVDLESHYEKTGFASLEWMAQTSAALPLLFRVVQISPEGSDMKPVSADSLGDVMTPDTVIRVGLAGEVCIADSLHAPQMQVGPDGTVEVGGDDWHEVTGFSTEHGHSGPRGHASEVLGERTAQHVLSYPGLYAAVPDPPIDACLILRRDDSDELWKVLG